MKTQEAAWGVRQVEFLWASRCWSWVRRRGKGGDPAVRTPPGDPPQNSAPLLMLCLQNVRPCVSTSACGCRQLPGTETPPGLGSSALERPCFCSLCGHSPTWRDPRAMARGLAALWGDAAFTCFTLHEAVSQARACEEGQAGDLGSDYFGPHSRPSARAGPHRQHWGPALPKRSGSARWGGATPRADGKPGRRPGALAGLWRRA